MLRYWGLAFQLLGILTVVSGLRDKRHLFNRPGLVENLRRWINRRPRWGGAKPQLSWFPGQDRFQYQVAREFSVWRGAPADASVEGSIGRAGGEPRNTY